MRNTERIEALIKKGNEVLATHKSPPAGVIGFPTLSHGAFTEWQTQTINFLKTILPNNSVYIINFEKRVNQAYKSEVEAGIGILRAVKEDLENGICDEIEVKRTPTELLENIFGRFHLIARQLRSRYNNRSTLDITDEYDVQDLIHAILMLNFDDIRAEEWTPSYAGKCARMDFLLKTEQIVIEIKKTRRGLTEKELGGQLIEDIARYKTHPDCKLLLCFVYDPEGLIANPRGIENDLRRVDSDMPVEVVIRP